MEEGSRYCLHCKTRVFVRRRDQHHALLGFMTFAMLAGSCFSPYAFAGLIFFVILWGVHATLGYSPWRCSRCGSVETTEL